MSQYELDFWGDCANTFHEEQKQLAYAPRMGLRPIWDCAHPPTFDLAGKSVIDIGGGPVSLLLKCVNGERMVVADPAPYPDWIMSRYAAHGIEYWRQPGEEIDGYSFDESWIYNVLQHVQDPRKVVEQARAIARMVRLFEWVDTPVYAGHPHSLGFSDLRKWLGAPGFETTLDENGAVGRAFYGVFPGCGV